MIAQILSNYSFLKFFVVSKSVDESRHILVGRKIRSQDSGKRGALLTVTTVKSEFLFWRFASDCDFLS
jgi:hypothetical protein